MVELGLRSRSVVFAFNAIAVMFTYFRVLPRRQFIIISRGHSIAGDFHIPVRINISK